VSLAVSLSQSSLQRELIFLRSFLLLSSGNATPPAGLNLHPSRRRISDLPCLPNPSQRRDLPSRPSPLLLRRQRSPFSSYLGHGRIWEDRSSENQHSSSSARELRRCDSNGGGKHHLSSSANGRIVVESWERWRIDSVWSGTKGGRRLGRVLDAGGRSDGGSSARDVISDLLFLYSLPFSSHHLLDFLTIFAFPLLSALLSSLFIHLTSLPSHASSLCVLGPGP